MRAVLDRSSSRHLRGHDKGKLEWQLSAPSQMVRVEISDGLGYIWVSFVCFTPQYI
jgi:hypothetical protein